MFRLNSKGQMAATEFIVIAVLLLICVLEGIFIFTKKTDMTVYQDGSKPRVTEFSPQCAPLSCCVTHVQETNDARAKIIPSHPNNPVKPKLEVKK